MRIYLTKSVAWLGDSSGLDQAQLILNGLAYESAVSCQVSGDLLVSDGLSHRSGFGGLFSEARRDDWTLCLWLASPGLFSGPCRVPGE